jgi:hypothetical protein
MDRSQKLTQTLLTVGAAVGILALLLVFFL